MRAEADRFKPEGRCPFYALNPHLDIFTQYLTFRRSGKFQSIVRDGSEIDELTFERRLEGHRAGTTPRQEEMDCENIISTIENETGRIQIDKSCSQLSRILSGNRDLESLDRETSAEEETGEVEDAAVSLFKRCHPCYPLPNTNLVVPIICYYHLFDIPARLLAEDPIAHCSSPPPDLSSQIHL
ncbi:hypothetical protein E1301_Tti015460 [Triplophysa tibetana]|uniref:Uncharacterized protein n=1 Tax=Triplophysa tibetana TaxID=1572043 RepID=A0A5A9PLN5_9TELE|nr:hypothetical protein E1301_Tti015460 [Triplophysa tibetana]